MAVVGNSSLEEPQASIFWIGNLDSGVGEILEKWGRHLKEQLRKPGLPETEFHCTMRYDPLRSPELEKDWLEKTQGQTVQLTSDYLIVGSAGEALHIEECDFTKT